MTDSQKISVKKGVTEGGYSGLAAFTVISLLRGIQNQTGWEFSAEFEIALAGAITGIFHGAVRWIRDRLKHGGK